MHRARANQLRHLCQRGGRFGKNHKAAGAGVQPVAKLWQPGGVCRKLPFFIQIPPGAVQKRVCLRARLILHQQARGLLRHQHLGVFIHRRKIRLCCQICGALPLCRLPGQIQPHHITRSKACGKGKLFAIHFNFVFPQIPVQGAHRKRWLGPVQKCVQPHARLFHRIFPHLGAPFPTRQTRGTFHCGPPLWPALHFFQVLTLYHKYRPPAQGVQLTSSGVYCKMDYRYGTVLQSAVHAVLLWRNRQTQGT